MKENLLKVRNCATSDSIHVNCPLIRSACLLSSLQNNIIITKGCFCSHRGTKEDRGVVTERMRILFEFTLHWKSKYHQNIILNFYCCVELFSLSACFVFNRFFYVLYVIDRRNAVDSEMGLQLIKLLGLIRDEWTHTRNFTIYIFIVFLSFHRP